MTDYIPPRVWKWEQPSGGQFANINRPVAGATHERELPVGEHPFQTRQKIRLGNAKTFCRLRIGMLGQREVALQGIDDGAIDGVELTHSAPRSA